MIYMCLEIEKHGTKSFQFFPLRTNIVPKFILIDTASLIDLFAKGKKEEYNANIEEKKNEIWSKYFKLNAPIFKQKNYSFDHMISTDCFSVSIHLIRNDQIKKKKEMVVNNKKAIRATTERRKGMTPQEIEAERQKIQKETEEKKVKRNLESQRKKEESLRIKIQQQNAYNALSTEEKEKKNEERKKLNEEKRN